MEYCFEDLGQNVVCAIVWNGSLFGCLLLFLYIGFLTSDYKLRRKKMTIKELVDEHGFGVKIRGENKGRDAFTVKYEYDGFFCGHYNDGYCAKYPVDDECWELYPEPKPKVMRAQYWYKSNESAIPHISRPYKDDEEFLHYAPETVDWYKRLEEIECES